VAEERMHSFNMTDCITGVLLIYLLCVMSVWGIRQCMKWIVICTAMVIGTALGSDLIWSQFYC